jgi:hypothetical protein
MTLALGRSVLEYDGSLVAPDGHSEVFVPHTDDDSEHSRFQEHSSTFDRTVIGLDVSVDVERLLFFVVTMTHFLWPTTGYKYKYPTCSPLDPASTLTNN